MADVITDRHAGTDTKNGRTIFKYRHFVVLTYSGKYPNVKMFEIFKRENLHEEKRFNVNSPLPYVGAGYG